MMHHLLVFSDDPALVRSVRQAVGTSYHIHRETNERRLYIGLATRSPAAIVVDGRDRAAARLCQRLRATTTVPLMVLAGRDPGEAVRFLQAGADDVLPTDTPPEEIGARLAAKVRRAAIEREGLGEAAPLGTVRQTVIARQHLCLSPTDLRLLRALQEGDGAFVPCGALQQMLWSGDGSSGRLVS